MNWLFHRVFHWSFHLRSKCFGIINNINPYAVYIESARQIDRRKGRRIQSKDEETKTSISWCLLWVTNIIVWPLKVHLYFKNTSQYIFPPFKNTRSIHIYAHCWCYFSFFHLEISVAQNVPLFSRPTKRIAIIIFWFVFAMVFAIEWFCMKMVCFVTIHIYL